jgi:hypothetical protein
MLYYFKCLALPSKDPLSLSIWIVYYLILTKRYKIG